MTWSKINFNSFNARKRKALLFVSLIVAEFFMIGLYSIVPVISNHNSTQKNAEKVVDSVTSHSSPYYFPVEATSPLLNGPEDASEGTAKQAYISNLYTINVHLAKSAVSPGESVNAQITIYNNLSRVAYQYVYLYVWRGFYRYYSYYYSNYYSSEQVYQKSVLTNGEGEVNVVIPGSYLSETGMYTLEANLGGEYSYTDFSVGKLGLYFKGPYYTKPGHQYQASIHLVNITGFTPLPFTIFDFDVSYYSNSYNWVNSLNGTGQTDVFGYGLLDTIIPSYESPYSWWFNQYRLRIKATNNTGTVVFETYLYETWDAYYYSRWGGQQVTNEERYQFVVTTDKTIYTPGDTVHLRALTWDYQYQNATKRPVINQTIQLTVYNPDAVAIFWTTVLTDNFGVLTFNLPLDQDVDTGVYGIEFTYRGYSHKYNFKVEFYTKPVFRLQIDTAGQDFFPKYDFWEFKDSPPFAGAIIASYYFGQAVVDAEVILKIKDYSGTTQKEIEGRTNGEGRFAFSIDLDLLSNLDYSFTVTVEVTDIYGRKAATEKRYTRLNELYTYGYLNDWAPSIGDEMIYYYYAYQLLMNEKGMYWGYDYNPLVNVNGTVEVYGSIYYPIYFTTISGQIFIKSYSVQTNQYGSGELPIKLNLLEILPYQFFEIRITITLEDGRIATSSTYFRYRRYDLSINLEEEHFLPGDTVTFTANYVDRLTGFNVEGQGYLYIYTSEYNLLTEGQMNLYGPQTYNVKLPTNAPAGRYYISSYVYSQSNNFFGGFEYHSAWLSFTVGSAQELTFTSNATAADAYNYYKEINVGQTLQITGSSSVITNMPIYLGIYKRGLYALYRLILTDNEFTFEIPITIELGSQITLQIYTISNIGIIFEASEVIKISQNWNFTLTTDKSIYEPGDTVSLTITPQGVPSLLAVISFIDSAVLDVEPEDDSEEAYFTETDYWSFIYSSATWGGGVPWMFYWWSNTRYYGGYYMMYGGLEDDAVYEMAPNAFGIKRTTAGAQASPPSFSDLLSEFDTEIRKNITESANWIPEFVIEGTSNFTFKLPDNIGEWTIRVVGTYESWGQIQSIAIKTFLPFFIEFDISEPIRQDDILSVKAYVYNYLGATVEAYVAIESPNLPVLNLETQYVRIPDGFVSEVEFSVLVAEPYLQNVTILAATMLDGLAYSDAKLQTIYVTPNGIEKRDFFRGFLNATTEEMLVSVSIDADTIYKRGYLTLYTSLLDTSLAGWEALIGYPYGCIEQTMSKLLPTALVYQYLNTTAQLTPELRGEMEQMIFQGLSRVYAFQLSSGAWGWWEEDAYNIQMTAVVLAGLNLIKEAGFEINSQVISRAKSFLLSHENVDYEWSMEYSSLTTMELTALVVRALITTNNLSTSETTQVNTALAEFKTNWEVPTDRTPYAATLFYIATQHSTFADPIFASNLISYLLTERQSGLDGSWWSNPERWSNLGGATEVTALAVWVLADADFFGHFGVIREAVTFLLNQRNRWGWWTTADTAAAILSFTKLAQITGGTQLIDFNGTLQISINSPMTPQLTLNFSSEDTHLPEDIGLYLQSYFVTGSNSINLSVVGTGILYYTLEVTQIIRPNPTVTIPAIFTVAPNEDFVIPVTFNAFSSILNLEHVSIKCRNVDNALQTSGSQMQLSLDRVLVGETVNLTFKSPNTLGNCTIKSIKVQGFFTLQNAIDSSDRKIFRQEIGPIVIIVTDQPHSADNTNSIDIYPTASSSDFSTPSSSSSDLSLSKSVTIPSTYKQGDVIDVTIRLKNTGDKRQYYALEDMLPSGTTFVDGSLEISGSDTYTIDDSVGGIDLFFNSIPVGEIRVEYQVQTQAVKNVYLGTCVLWSMYDNVTLTALSDLLEPIPMLYSPDQILYRDEILPTITVDDYSQIDGVTPTIKVTWDAQDNAPLGKIRFVFRQSSGWRSQMEYLAVDGGEFNSILSDLENIDGEMVFFVEVTDIYGNLMISPIYRLNIRSTLIPAITVIIIGLVAILVAGVVSIYTRRRYSRVLNGQRALPYTGFVDPRDNPI